MALIATNLYPDGNSVCEKNGILYALLSNGFAEDKILYIYSSADGGNNWNLVSSRDIGEEISDGYLSSWHMFIDADSILHILYNTSEGIFYRTYSNGTWSAQVTIAETDNPEGYFGHEGLFTIDGNGQIHAFISSIKVSDSSKALFYKKQASGIWQGAELVYEGTSSDSISHISLITDSSNNPKAFVSGTLDTNYFQIFLFEKGGGGWEYEQLTSPGNYYHLGVAYYDYVADRIFLTYSKFSLMTGKPSLLCMMVYDYGEWGEEEIVLNYEDEDYGVASIGASIDEDGTFSLPFAIMFSLDSNLIDYLGVMQRTGGSWGEPIPVYERSEGEKGIYSFDAPSSNPIYFLPGYPLFYSLAYYDPEEGYSDFETNFYGLGYGGTEFGISSISPSSGGSNRLITINGMGFGESKENSRVVFEKNGNIYYADVVSWGNTKIECYSPEAGKLDSYNVFVQIVNE